VADVGAAAIPGARTKSVGDAGAVTARGILIREEPFAGCEVAEGCAFEVACDFELGKAVGGVLGSAPGNAAACGTPAVAICGAGVVSIGARAFDARGIGIKEKTFVACASGCACEAVCDFESEAERGTILGAGALTTGASVVKKKGSVGCAPEESCAKEVCAFEPACDFASAAERPVAWDGTIALAKLPEEENIERIIALVVGAFAVWAFAVRGFEVWEFAA
jgi:hypothetical protein